MKLNTYNNIQSSSYRMSGVLYHALVSLQAATICCDCLPGTRIDHRPLATLTCQDSRTRPENNKHFMLILKDGPYHQQLHTALTNRDGHGGYTCTGITKSIARFRIALRTALK